MALTQIELTPGGRVIWVKLSQAAKLVAQAQARYVAAVAEAEPEAIPEMAAPRDALKSTPKRRRR